MIIRLTKLNYLVSLIIVSYVDEDIELELCDDFDYEKCFADPLDVEEIEISEEEIEQEEMEIYSNLPCTSA